MLKKKVLIIISVMLVLFLGGCKSSDDNLLKIGVLQFAPHQALDAAYDGFIEQLEALGLKEGEHYKLSYHNAQGDIIMAETIAGKLVNDKNDLIYAIATPAAQAVANKTTEIPIILSAVTDPFSSGLVKSNENPQTNVSGVSDLTPIKRQISLLNEIADVKNVAIMYSNHEDNSRFQADIAKAELENLNINYIDASVSETAQIIQVLQSLINKVDAIYVPTDNLVSDSFSTVADFAIEHKLVTMVGEIAMVNKGGLITDGVDYLNIGRKAGEMAFEVLVNNKNISELAIVYLEEKDLELAINKSTMEKLGIIISDDILNNAIIVE